MPSYVKTHSFSSSLSSTSIASGSSHSLHSQASESSTNKVSRGDRPQAVSSPANSKTSFHKYDLSTDRSTSPTSTSSVSSSSRILLEKPKHSAPKVKEVQAKTEKDRNCQTVLDLTYQNIYVTNGHGRRRVGSGSGAPTGCVLM